MAGIEQTFDSKEYAFSDIVLICGGQKIDNITSIEYGVTQTKTAIYGKGVNPVAIQRGQKSVTGTIKMLQSAYETLVLLSPKKDLLALHVDASISYGNPQNGDMLIIDLVHGIEFTDQKKTYANGDANMEIELPFVALSVEYQKNL